MGLIVNDIEIEPEKLLSGEAKSPHLAPSTVIPQEAHTHTYSLEMGNGCHSR